jgi:hypothetical protein
MLVKFSEAFFNKFVVYLMRRGDWWRIGMTSSGHRPYFGTDVNTRLCAEKADGAWILGVFPTRKEALIEEAKLQGFFGIPGTIFEVSSKDRILSSKQLFDVQESFKEVVAPRARRLLDYFGLEVEYPLYTAKRAPAWAGNDLKKIAEAAKTEAVNKSKMFVIRACNLLSDYMEIPVITDAFIHREGTHLNRMKPEFYPIKITKTSFEGKVYSLVVTPYHHYISGGAVVHNSTKGAQWKNVYVSMPAGKFPFKLPQKPGDPPPDPEEVKAEMESERRLGYVALTRAAMNLTVICPNVVGGKAAGISEFVDEAGLKVGENVPKPGAPSKEESVPVKTAFVGYEDTVPDEWVSPDYDRRSH